MIRLRPRASAEALTYRPGVLSTPGLSLPPMAIVIRSDTVAVLHGKAPVPRHHRAAAGRARDRRQQSRRSRIMRPRDWPLDLPEHQVAAENPLAGQARWQDQMRWL